MLRNKELFTQAIFAPILAACKLLVIQIAAESPIVYTGDLKSPQNRA